MKELQKTEPSDRNSISLTELVHSPSVLQPQLQTGAQAELCRARAVHTSYCSAYTPRAARPKAKPSVISQSSSTFYQLLHALDHWAGGGKVPPSSGASSGAAAAGLPGFVSTLASSHPQDVPSSQNQTLTSRFFFCLNISVKQLKSCPLYPQDPYSATNILGFSTLRQLAVTGGTTLPVTVLGLFITRHISQSIRGSLPVSRV